MSALRQGTLFALRAGFGLILVGCGASPMDEAAGGAGSGVPVVDNFPGNAGQNASDGFKGWRKPDAAGSGGSITEAAAGSGGSAGSAGATAPAAGSGGEAGDAASAGSGAAGSGMSAPADPLDIFGLGSAGAPAEDPLDIFNLGDAQPEAVSCAGLLCTELADCQNLYPTEHATCNFTQCVDLECK